MGKRTFFLYFQNITLEITGSQSFKKLDPNVVKTQIFIVGKSKQLI